MTAVHLPLIPAAAGYGVQYGPGVIGTPVEQGLPRLRLDFIAGPNIVNVVWNLNEDKCEFTFFTRFFEATLCQGTLPFSVDLVIDGAPLERYEARFVPRSVALTEHIGYSYTMSAQIYAVRDVSDVDEKASTALLYALSDGDPATYANLLSNVVNNLGSLDTRRSGKLLNNVSEDRDQLYIADLTEVMNTILSDQNGLPNS